MISNKYKYTKYPGKITPCGTDFLGQRGREVFSRRQNRKTRISAENLREQYTKFNPHFRQQISG